MCVRASAPGRGLRAKYWFRALFSDINPAEGHRDSCKMHAICDDEFIMQPYSSKRLRALARCVHKILTYALAAFFVLRPHWGEILPCRPDICERQRIFYPNVSQIERFYGLLAGRVKSVNELERAKMFSVLKWIYQVKISHFLPIALLWSIFYFARLTDGWYMLTTLRQV